MKTTGKVVLFYPPYDGPPLGAPLCLLSLASPLIAAGFDVVLVDGVISPGFEREILRETEGALCLGISLLTGRMINAAIQVARAVRELRPQLPIIFGGWHPTLMPEQTLSEPYVDAVVRAQGELTLVELVERIAEGHSWEGIRGLSFKAGMRVQQEQERPVANINQLPAPAFHLAQFDRYESLCGFRQLGYASSMGCPYACNYCTDMVFYKRRFNAYRAEKVVADLAELVPRFRIDEVALLDSNFLVDIKRAIQIARGIVESKVKFRWTFQASTDFLWRMSDDDVRLLGESGVSHMGFGTESASQDVLRLMNKHHQRVEQMVETARKAELAGIRVTFNVILGYPGETRADRTQTFQIMSDIAREYSNVSFSPNIFTPYPGIPIWPELRGLGVYEPQSLAEWQDISLGHNVLPWLQGEELRHLRRSLEYFLLNNQIRKVARRFPRLRRGVRRALGAPVRWRIAKDFYSFPWELWVSRAAEPLVTRRSLLTGQQLSDRMQEVCPSGGDEAGK
ncbi:MAG: B12-binding domain-containing radical SAM protein [Acidobacteria bacterium]|nr:B12-binding domain-containing radical SAM protein [Acidobacteriota bacterium]